MVLGWAAMLPCAYLLALLSLPASPEMSLLAFVIGFTYVLPASFAVLVVGVLITMALRHWTASGLWLGVTSSWLATAIVAIGVWLL
ncbi:hypothetical protein Cme02nite_64770 [Catellatospora methionotrophica]|uniref:Uncharacterized protein n=1 Tax=Catellatospora methionotrophica TaxID=121620 RepID=A0A8J3LP29_9ACTN|nr:hypothetical protein [Catellatospora methionotrophica]GIG18145.1 hypothetical protein Cme02nite_64770 [Catellatospora methionotrophica]